MYTISNAKGFPVFIRAMLEMLGIVLSGRTCGKNSFVWRLLVFFYVVVLVCMG